MAGMGMARGIFKLIVAITADSAQLKDDLNEAEKKLADSKKKSEEWGNALGNVFKKATKGLDQLVPGFSDAAGAIGKAIGSSKGLATSLGLVKTAVAATGIGALVIALVSLVTWVAKTTQGMDFLKKALTAIKAVINTVIGRLAKMGEAIVLLLKGEFKAAAQKAKEAVSDLGAEIKDNYQEGLALGERSNQQKKDTIALIYQQVDAEAELARLNAILDDKSKSFAERQEALTQLKQVQANIDAKNVAMATEAYSIAVKENSIGTKTYEKMQEEAELYEKMVQSQTTKSNNVAKLESAQRSLNAEIQKEQEARAKAAFELQKKLDLEGAKDLQKKVKIAEIPPIVPQLDTTAIATQLALVKPASLIPQDTPEWKKYWDAVDALAEESTQNRLNSMNTGLQTTASLLDSISQLQEAAMNKELAAAGDNEAKKEQIQKKYARKQKRIAVAQALINGALAVTNLLANAPGSVINPATWVAIAAAGIATAAQVALIASQPLAKGGIAYGETLATVGEYANARTNPEIIAPLDKLKSILGTSGAMSGEVRFVIEQNALVGILEKANSKNIYF